MTPQSSDPAATPRPSLAREMLWNLALLMTAALSLAVITALAAQALEPRFAVVALLFLIGADIAVLFVFGRYLIRRLILGPVRQLAAAADALAAGYLERRAPMAETAEFTHLAERLNDMTEALLDAQSQLMRAEKLAGIGRLSAGIAHEIGNPLTALGTYVEVLEKRAVEPDMTSAIRREIDRIDQIIRGLLSYARSDPEDLGPVDVDGVVRSVVDLLTRQGTLKGRDVSVECDGGLPRVRGRTHGLEQVVVNLVLNAVDADPRGIIAVGARNWRQEPRWSAAVRLGEPETDRHRKPGGRRPWRPETTGAEGVLLYVADSGPGVPEPERDRIFDPFYTTKEPGKGTGLGLAIVQRTVHEMGGTVWVEDAREGGAVFKVFLPVSAP